MHSHVKIYAKNNTVTPALISPRKKKTFVYEPVTSKMRPVESEEKKTKEKIRH